MKQQQQQQQQQLVAAISFGSRSKKMSRE